MRKAKRGQARGLLGWQRGIFSGVHGSGSGQEVSGLGQSSAVTHAVPVFPLVAAGMIVGLFPETRGRTLEQTSQL